MNQSAHRLVLGLLMLSVGLSHPQPSNAIAYCALRDPVEAIRFLYPHAESHRSIVRAIDNDAREQILESLSFSLHFNELGKHTLYTILDDTKPIGFVHVRSELAPWGLMEVAWALSPDLTIKNFMFQRCRSSECSPEAIAAMLNLLADKSLEELKSYLSDNGENLTAEAAGHVSLNNKGFAAALVRSALKTIAVTGVTWADEISTIQRDALIREAFSASDIQAARAEIDEQAFQALKAVHNGGGSMLESASVVAYQVLDGDRGIGYVTSGRWHDHHQQRTTHWVFNRDGEVLSTRTVPRFAQQTYRESFEELAGLNVANAENCSTASQMMGHDMYFLASFKSD